MRYLNEHPIKSVLLMMVIALICLLLPAYAAGRGVYVSDDGFHTANPTVSFTGDRDLKWRARNSGLAVSRLGVDKFTVDIYGNTTIAGTLTSGALTSTYRPPTDNATPLGDHTHRWSAMHMAGVIYGDGGMDMYTAGALNLGANTATSVVIKPATTVTGQITATGGMTAANHVVITAAGKGFGIKTGGAAAMAGVSGAMTAGAITISTTSIHTGSLVFTTGRGTGATYVKNIVDGTSFDIYSTDDADTGTASWMIVAPQ